MHGASRFLLVVHRRAGALPAGGAALTFGGTAMFFDGGPLTFRAL